MICSLCSAEKNSEARLPRGWKRDGETIACASCWRERCVLRAVSLPIVEIMDGTWQEFRAALREAFAATTQAANWMMTELYARDVRRNGEAKMPPMLRQYLYPDARAKFPALPSQTVAALEQAVQAKYRAARYKIIWTCAQSLPTHRYPHPFPVPNQGWSVDLVDERPVVSLRLGERRWAVRLKGGPRFRRQLEAIKLLVGGAVKGQLDLYERGTDVMCKMVAWLPRKPAGNTMVGNTLVVRTLKDSLLVAINLKDEKMWAYHGDHLRRWSAEHRLQLQRWADDSKFEQRPVPSFADRRTNAARKYRHRMDTAVREIAAQLAGYTARRKFGTLRYDDSDTSYCDGFPWFALRERLRLKLDEMGIQFEYASGQVEEKDMDPLAEQQA